MLFEGRPVDVFTYVGYSRSHCGYCGKDDTSHSFGIWAHSLVPETYQTLIDRGWRRSGLYLYRPDLRQSCCKSYTIRLDAANFKPDKKHRQALYKFNRFVLGESLPKQQNKSEFVLQDVLNESERQSASDTRRSFKTTLEQANYTKEKFELYKKYQIAIHHDEPTSLKQSGFKRFLCDSPLQNSPLCTKFPNNRESDDALPAQYGSYHQLYRLDGQLIALAVLDILPRCVSSVYFIYDPEYAHLSLGRVSACREAALALSISDHKKDDIRGEKKTVTPGRSQPSQRQGGWHAKPTVDAFYYMGFYIPTCSKMAYKGEYSPSYLLDPASPYSLWYPLALFRDIWRQRKERKKHYDEPDPDEIDWLFSFINPNLESAKTPLAVDDDDLDDSETLWESGMPGISNRDTALPSGVKLLEVGHLRHLNHTDDEQVRKRVEAIGAAIGHDLLVEVIIAI